MVSPAKILKKGVATGNTTAGQSILQEIAGHKGEQCPANMAAG